MSTGLSPADRKLLAGTGALIVFLAALIGIFQEPQRRTILLPVPSTYSADPGGAAAAYQLLIALNYSVKRWEEPPAHLLEADSRAVFILAEPTATPTAGERDFLYQFVQNGGRILFCGKALQAFFDGASLAAVSHDAMELSPDLPSPFTRGARKVEIKPLAFWKSRKPEQVELFGGESDPVAVVWRLGRGELIWWASASPLTNQGIAKFDNKTLFLDAVSASAGQEPRPVYWDEYFHGSRGTLWAYVEATPLKWALAQSVCLLLAVLFAFSRRSGPVVTPRPISRLSTLEFVDTLGGLYESAGATSVATGIAYRHLRLTLSRRLLLPFGTPDTTLAKAAAQRLGWNGPELAAALNRADRSQTGNLRPREALDLVKNIGYYLDRLNDRRRPTEMN